MAVRCWFWRGFHFPYRWGSSNNHAATWQFWAHTSFSAVSLSAVYRGRAARLNIYILNWCKIQLFSEYFSWISCFPSIVRPNLTVHSVASTHLRRIFLDDKSLFWSPPINSRILGMEIFRILYITPKVIEEGTVNEMFRQFTSKLTNSSSTPSTVSLY